MKTTMVCGAYIKHPVQVINLVELALEIGCL